MQAGLVRQRESPARLRQRLPSAASGFAAPSRRLRLSRVSSVAFTRPEARRTMRAASPLLMMTSVSRLLAVVASLSRSKSMSGAPASTLSPCSNARSKTSAFQRDRINSNVHQHFHAIGRPESQGMRSGMECARLRRHTARAAFRRPDRWQGRRPSTSARRPGRAHARADKPLQITGARRISSLVIISYHQASA